MGEFFSNLKAHDVLDAFGALVVVASLLANVVPAHTIGGKICNWLAINGPKIQRGIVAVTKPPESAESALKGAGQVADNVKAIK